MSAIDFMHTEIVNAKKSLSDKEKLIYEFLIVNNEKDPEIKISQWMKHLDKYSLKVIEAAFYDFNKTKKYSEKCSISNVLERVQVPETEDSEKKQERLKRKSASVYSRMLRDYVQKNLKISFSDFVSSSYFTPDRKFEIMDRVEGEFIKKYGHTPEQEWGGEL